MKKTIWIVNKHIRPPEYETHFRYIKYAKYLTELGYDVKIFCSGFQHQLNIELIKGNQEYFEVKYDEIPYILVKTIAYQGNGLKRIFSLFQFTAKVIKYGKKHPKPDVIIHTSNTPFTNKLSAFAKKWKSQYIVEILDLWPESFVSFGLMSRKNPLIKLAFNLEKKLYERANNIVFSMEGGVDYIKEKKWDKQYNRGSIDLNKILHINNSVDFSDFENIKNKYTFNDPDLDDDHLFKVVYVGSISLANNLKMLIEAAVILKSSKSIKFLIYGNGDEREQLEDFCKNHSLTNVSFKEKRIDYNYIPSLLSKSSLNILNFKQVDVVRYGGSQGKLFNYIASGKPICSNVKMGYCLINKNNLGIAINFESSEEYAEAILSISNLSKNEYDSMCKRVFDVAQEYDFRKQAQKLISVIN